MGESSNIFLAISFQNLHLDYGTLWNGDSIVSWCVHWNFWSITLSHIFIYIIVKLHYIEKKYLHIKCWEILIYLYIYHSKCFSFFPKDLNFYLFSFSIFLNNLLLHFLQLRFVSNEFSCLFVNWKCAYFAFIIERYVWLTIEFWVFCFFF